MRSILLLALPVAVAAGILGFSGVKGGGVFKKQGVAWVLTFVMIAAAVGIGRAKASSSAAPEPGLLDDSLDTSYYTRFIDDRAGVLNGSAEKQLALYLANWDTRYHSKVAFVSVSRVSGGTEDYADDTFEDLGLGDGDALLLVVGAGDDYQFVWGDAFDSIMTDKASNRLTSALSGGSWQDGVLSFYATLDGIYVENFGLGDGGTQSGSNPAPAQSGHRTSAAPALVTLVLMIVIVVLILSAIDRGRYNAYRRQYYGAVSPPVIFRPIFFWHGPRSSWYRRNWRQPPPPPPPTGPRGPGGFGGTPPRPPSGGHRPSGGFGGTPPRTPAGGHRPSGGFGGTPPRTPSGGSRPSGSFDGSGGSSRPGGSFGGTRSGGSRPSGGFGGSRGGSRPGGSFGGTRSGGSRPSGGFGGSRGGGGRSGGRR